MDITIDIFDNEKLRNASLLQMYLYILLKAEQNQTQVVRVHYAELREKTGLSYATIQKNLTLLDEMFEVVDKNTYYIGCENDVSVKGRINLDTIPIKAKNKPMCHRLLNKLLSTYSLDEILQTLCSAKVSEWLKKQYWFCLDWALANYEKISKGTYEDKQLIMKQPSFSGYKNI